MESDIKILGDEFIKKNASLLRDIMEPHHISFEVLEFAEGKATKVRIKAKNYKEKST